MALTAMKVAPFQAAPCSRTAGRMPRSIVTAHARQGPNDAVKKAAGALAAVQLALLPLTGAAVADVLPSTSDLQHQVLFGIGEKVQDLKSNVDQAAKTKDDAAEQVTPESPGSSQESNAEKVRQQAENGPTSGGDARAPTN